MQTTRIVFDQELSLLQKKKGSLCLSVILPVTWISPNRQTDIHAVQRKMAKVRKYLRETCQGAETRPLLQSLDELVQEVDFSHNMEGLGLFVSAQIRLWVPFLFPVKEKILLSDSFETRDLLYHNDYALAYHVLLLSKNEARLFTGVLDQLQEIKDARFPFRFVDDYEYSRPSRGQAYEGHAVVQDFEREKSQLKAKREETFFHQLDNLLKSYFAVSDTLIISGTEKERSYFVNRTSFTNIPGQLHGNMFYLPVQALGESSWRIMKWYVDNIKNRQVQELEEKKGRDEAVSGISDCWQAAFQGNGARLLVEKDFSCPGYLPNDTPDHLHLVSPEGSYKVLPDAVTSLIKLVQEKGGEVVLVEESTLNHFQHVGLVLRY